MIESINAENCGKLDIQINTEKNVLEIQQQINKNIIEKCIRAKCNKYFARNVTMKSY